MPRKEPRPADAAGAKALDVAALSGTPVTLGVVLVCCGALCTPIVALFVLFESTKDKVVTLEARIGSVDEKVGTATAELKQLEQLVGGRALDPPKADRATAPTQASPVGAAATAARASDNRPK